jgi:hypothetical protein
MKTRGYIRNDEVQSNLELHGAAVTPFLFPENINWLQKLFSENNSITSNIDLHDTLNEKLQSKVEYRCINCSPFYIYFNYSSAYTNRTIQVRQSITDELRYGSLCFIAPLTKAGKQGVRFHYLKGSHRIATPVRGQNFSHYYEQATDFVKSNLTTVEVKGGDAMVFYSHVPYHITAPDRVLLLEADILPYEARPIIYEQVNTNGEILLQPYETDLQPYLNYMAGNHHALLQMKQLRPVTYIPDFLKEHEMKQLQKNNSLRELFLSLFK